jgi:hypothetical protein
MTHIDEGTIHAWLDGQLDATRAREVETHVASCAQCSDAVAEARGLIAGSSRVLLALDDVPGGVVPATSKAAPPKPPRRKWQAAKWVTSVSALAAAVIVAVVLRQSSQSETANVAIHDSNRTSPVAAAAPAAGETSTASTAPATLRSAGPAEPARVATQQLAHADTRTSGRIAAAQPRALNDALAQRGAVAGGFSAASGAGVASTTNQAKATNAEVTQAPPATVMADAAGQRPSSAVSADERKMDVAAPVVVGCYAVSARQRDLESASARAPATVPLTAQKSSRAAPSSAAAADYAPAPSMIVRLDSIRGVEGLLARIAPADTVAGVWRVDGDTARVQLRNGTTFSVALSARIRCP